MIIFFENLKFWKCLGISFKNTIKNLLTETHFVKFLIFALMDSLQKCLVCFRNNYAYFNALEVQQIKALDWLFIWNLSVYPYKWFYIIFQQD